MIDGQTVLAVIPARGGSKGLPGKNTISVDSKPLIAWTIEAAQNSKLIDRIILSSDDDNIISVANKYGCENPFKRPDELATDEASIYDVLLYTLEQLEETYDYLVLLQPTSPLRNTADIDDCLTLCLETKSPACVSVCKSAKSPHWMYWLDHDKHMKPVLDEFGETSRRQELASAYVVNGAVYVAHVDWFQENKTFISPNTTAYVMPHERSVDIDEEWDLAVMKAALNLK